MIADEAEADPDKVHLTARVPLDAPADVVKDEARKGYDLMFIGLEDSVEPDGGFAPKINQLAAGFEGPLMVLANGGQNGLARQEPHPGAGQRHRPVAPCRGSGFCLGARHRRGGGNLVRFPDRRPCAHPAREESVLRDMTELAERYEVEIKTRISKRAAAAGAMLTEASGASP